MRVRKSAEDRKAEITQTALSLAFEIGPDRVTTGMIAGRLGLTQPAVYRHFPSKEDIWRAAIDGLCDRIAANIAEAANVDTSDLRLRKLVMGHLQLVREYPALPDLMVMREPTGAQTELQLQILTSVAAFREALIEAIGDARASGTYRTDIDAGDIATLVFGVIQGLVLRLLRSRDTSKLLSEGERLLNLQLRLLKNKGD